MKILFASGDVGGARALLPVISLCEKKKTPFSVLAHGFITNEIPPHWPTVSENEITGDSFFRQNNVSAIVFTSSAKDTVPLTIARKARKADIPVVHLLDNWAGYRIRMQTDGLPMLKPDIYAVMDEFSADEAVKEGIPASTIAITGQPAIASLSETNRRFTETIITESRKADGFTPGKRLVVFVSEPVSTDQGESPLSPRYRGYTEKTVLKLFCELLQPAADDIELGILPHPRENRKETTDTWNKFRGRLTGSVLNKKEGRLAVLTADGIAGMASLLLYEAFLTGKPVLSIQPDLRLKELRMLEQKENVFFADTEEKAADLLPLWLSEVTLKKNHPNQELHIHESASRNVLDLILKIANGH